MINPELFLNLPDFFIRDSILSFLPTDSLMRLVIAIGKAPSASDDDKSSTIRRLLVIAKESLLVRNEKILAQLEELKEDRLVEFLNSHFTALADTETTTFFETACACCVILAYLEEALKNRCNGSKMVWPVGLGPLSMEPFLMDSDFGTSPQRVSMTFRVLISSPLKWNPSLIAQIKNIWWTTNATNDFLLQNRDLNVTDFNFVGLVTHLEGGGYFDKSDGTRGESGFAYVDRTVGDDGMHAGLECDGVNDIILLTHGFAEMSGAYASLIQSQYVWLREEKVSGRNFFCLWEWVDQEEDKCDEAAVIRFMADFVELVRTRPLGSPFHK
jgi:hypothetical protein